MSYLADSRIHHFICGNGHLEVVEACDVLETLEDGCKKCGADIEKISEFPELVCPCGYATSSSDPYDLKSEYNQGCPNANEDFENQEAMTAHTLAVKDTSAAFYNEYKWAVRGPVASKLTRVNREDYWEYLIHYTDEESFLKIMTGSRTIQCSSNGFYYKSKPNESRAVCLTETPAQWSNDFFETYGEIGFVFRKSIMHKVGGAPVMNLTDSQIKCQESRGGFATELIPFVQLLRTDSTPLGKEKKRYDWLHDREWRVPCDIKLSSVIPVGMLYKDEIDFQNRGDFLWEKKILAAIEFGLVFLDEK